MLRTSDATFQEKVHFPECNQVAARWKAIRKGYLELSIIQMHNYESLA